MTKKILIIRFSSFGDIMQCLPAVTYLRQEAPDAQIHFLTRADFADVVNSYRLSPHDGTQVITAIDRVWQLDRKSGLRGLWLLIRQLKKEGFTHIYDAHSNLRSHLVTSILRMNLKSVLSRRSKNRFKRILLFWFRINKFPIPFRGADSYLEPLRKWFEHSAQSPVLRAFFDFSDELPVLDAAHTTTFHNYIAVVPGATWPLKEWPKNYWQEFIQNYGGPIVVLGGNGDTICENLVTPTVNRLNLAGQLSWLQSLRIISQAKLVVAGDTGLMHAADLLARPTIALIGPTAFGFPNRQTSKVLEVSLPCRPCTKDGRGRCHIKDHKSCLTSIKPDQVVKTARDILTESKVKTAGHVVI